MPVPPDMMGLSLAENEIFEMKKAKVEIQMRHHKEKRRVGGDNFCMDQWLAVNEYLEIKMAEVEIQMRHHMKKHSDNYRTTIREAIVKAKGLHDPVGHIDEQVGMIAKRMYLEKHRRLPMRTQVFPNGIESWVDAYVESDMPILEAAHDEFMIGVRRVIETLMDETEKKLEAEKQIKRARQEMELKQKDTKRRKLRARNVKGSS
jgi:hypothetical protein